MVTGFRVRSLTQVGFIRLAHILMPSRVNPTWLAPRNDELTAFIISAPRRSLLPRFQKPPKGVRTRNLAVQGIGSAKRRARTRPFSYSGAVLPRRASRGFRRAGPASIPASPSGFPRLVPSRERRDGQRLVVGADGYPKPPGIARRCARQQEPLSLHEVRTGS
jgi:hypothetical protein